MGPQLSLCRQRMWLLGLAIASLIVVAVVSTAYAYRPAISREGRPVSNVPAPSERKHTDLCLSRYPSGLQKTTKAFGGTQTTYDRQASLYQVCGGFGAPEGLHLSPAMKCALIAAAATYGGPEVSAGTSQLCDAVGIASAFRSGDWLGVAASKGCGYFSDVFAGGVGVFAAGATSETGPGAVAVGVSTYKALAAGLKITCGGLFDGGASALGRKLEANHETNIGIDIVSHGKCLKLRRLFGQLRWSATRCPGVSDGSPGPQTIKCSISYGGLYETLATNTDCETAREVYEYGEQVGLSNCNTEPCSFSYRGWSCIQQLKQPEGSIETCRQPPGRELRYFAN